jgi:hypothetical protein
MRKEEKKGRRRIGLTAVVALALFFCLISTITLAGAAVVKVSPPTQTVIAGESFSVDVRVEGVTSMGAGDADLNFDPGAMSVSSVTEGDFLKSVGTTVAIPPIIDNTAGTATFSYSLTTPCVGANGSGVLATIYFNTLPAAAPGAYKLDLEDVNLADCAGSPITVGVTDGAVTIQPFPVPGLSGTGMIAAIGVLAIVLAISSVRRKRRK